MRYEEQPPEPSLAAHVHCTWLFEGVEEAVEQAIPPDGRCELIAHCRRPYEERGDDGAWHAQPRLLFAGQLLRPLVLRSRGEVAVLGVRFTPAGAWAFAGRPLSRCTDRRVDLAELHGAPAVAALQEVLDGCADADARRDALNAYVAAQIALRQGRRDAGVELCVDRMLASEGRVSVAELGALAGLGPRGLQRRFAEVVGISPRALGSVVRLRRVFEALREAPLATWSERAQAAGFFDHPQMARDFRRLLGTAPSQWRSAGPGLAASLADADA